jgi:hypothetical protein
MHMYECVYSTAQTAVSVSSSIRPGMLRVNGGRESDRSSEPASRVGATSGRKCSGHGRCWSRALHERRTTIGQTLNLVAVLDDVHERHTGHLPYPAAEVAITLRSQPRWDTRIEGGRGNVDRDSGAATRTPHCAPSHKLRHVTLLSTHSGHNVATGLAHTLHEAVVRVCSRV